MVFLGRGGGDSALPSITGPRRFFPAGGGAASPPPPPLDRLASLNASATSALAMALDSWMLGSISSARLKLWIALSRFLKPVMYTAPRWT